MRREKPYLTLKDWLLVFQRAAQEGGRLLPFSSLCRVTDLSPSAARKALGRLEQKKLLSRVGPGLYSSSLFPASLEEISMSLARPGYISFETVLSRHGVLSQSPMLITCATQKKPRTIMTPAGEVALRHLARGLFWGFGEENGVFWAAPEKALLDWLYWKLQAEGKAPDLDELSLEDLDLGKLQSWSRKYPKSVQKLVAQRTATTPTSPPSASG